MQKSPRSVVVMQPCNGKLQCKIIVYCLGKDILIPLTESFEQLLYTSFRRVAPLILYIVSCYRFEGPSTDISDFHIICVIIPS
jgi:hypothetical protein